MLGHAHNYLVSADGITSHLGKVLGTHLHCLCFLKSEITDMKLDQLLNIGSRIDCRLRNPSKSLATLVLNLHITNLGQALRSRVLEAQPQALATELKHKHKSF